MVRLKRNFNGQTEKEMTRRAGRGAGDALSGRRSARGLKHLHPEGERERNGYEPRDKQVADPVWRGPVNNPGGNPGANPQSISHRCHLREVAFNLG